MVSTGDDENLMHFGAVLLRDCFQLVFLNFLLFVNCRMELKRLDPFLMLDEFSGVIHGSCLMWALC